MLLLAMSIDITRLKGRRGARGGPRFRLGPKICRNTRVTLRLISILMLLLLSLLSLLS